jgi:hypothetical protein
MAAGVVVGLLGIFTVVTIVIVAGGDISDFSFVFEEPLFLIVGVVVGLPAVLGVGLMFSFFNFIGVIRLSTQLGFAGGAIVGFLLGMLIPTVFDMELDALVLILWEWIWTGLGGILGRVIENTTDRFD